MIWKGYRNGKGSLKIGKGKFVGVGEEIPEKVLNAMDSKAKSNMEKAGIIGKLEAKKPQPAKKDGKK